MELWLDFLYLLTNNEYFRAGFISGLVFIAVVWSIWGLFFRLHVQWLKMRQFFEPIRKPGRVPTETGPSPASILFGCLGRIVVTVLVLAIVIVALLWLGNWPGR